MDVPSTVIMDRFILMERKAIGSLWNRLCLMTIVLVFWWKDCKICPQENCLDIFAPSCFLE